ncbi:DUF6545 domain-containing protein, partial [Nocardia salmonicida]|uniref:DUF6545 domain-containing protein n=1 Tax=Nocardia salmonicida TaxID=53431 RepID=UPI003664EFD7
MTAPPARLRTLHRRLLGSVTHTPATATVDHHITRSERWEQRRIATLQLHRATVEIRDAMLGLRSYAHDADPDMFATFTARERIPRSEWDTATLALQLARAADDRLAGITPRTETATPLSTSTSADLADEVSELLRLAKWWSPAHRFVAADRSASHRPAESPTQKT